MAPPREAHANCKKPFSTSFRVLNVVTHKRVALAVLLHAEPFDAEVGARDRGHPMTLSVVKPLNALVRSDLPSSCLLVHGLCHDPPTQHHLMK